MPSSACKKKFLSCAFDVASSSGEADPPYLSQFLRRLLCVRDSIVDFEPIERRRFLRIKPEFLGLFDEDLVLLQIVVKTAGFHLFTPAFDFRWGFLFAGLGEPLD